MKFLFESNYNNKQDRFVHYNEDEKVDAQVDFTVDDEKKTYTIDSTVVDPSLRGQGIGGYLMLEMANHARKSGYKIINVCPYAVKFFEKHQDENADVLA
ncbi:GNAT family N-acetyltransferase [Ligilactobacillus pobuzihii]|uniref:Acetyltransferase n=1 Tax=Ligilactobacillus pobuzihii TaxID=449659 RepID=A0A0R2LKZ6_9LACO|nr:GNAT family N-acetyltransferase [Ligilactobacillus pobuzihii]KRK10288.1 acetyltransferase [Ligilactobacillus pobuzihii E100301 = KCTC 13174]KRO02039.1 acetyltransferase [Ligilactobacillus pobuzihii]GEN48205.1 N-acetyltransferase [Ligilactobacillus pobuzihii]